MHYNNNLLIDFLNGISIFHLSVYVTKDKLVCIVKTVLIVFWFGIVYMIFFSVLNSASSTLYSAVHVSPALPVFMCVRECRGGGYSI